MSPSPRCRSILLALLVGPGLLARRADPPDPPLTLPAPVVGSVSLEAALRARRTSRDLQGPALTLGEASQLLWSAQGENRPGRRTVPSAHARYPLGLYLLTEGSPTLAAGTYRYRPGSHALERRGPSGVKAMLGSIQAMQAWIPRAPSVFVVTGSPLRIASRSPEPRMDYTFWEAGAASQALLLEAAALGLGSGVASGVDLETVGKGLGLPPEEKVLVLLPVGRIGPTR